MAIDDPVPVGGDDGSGGGGVRVIDLRDALSERYLAYALSTITSRSLPDVRDGMKPVQRRILFAMRELKLDPEGAFKKCARIVGDVIGKFHPHGDVAVYDALVRLAQDFSLRYPLVDGQGNFGNIDGDNAAAMRYTESRMTAVAQALLQGIDEDTVDFRPTYDGSEDEPVVLPAAFPNLLANGAAGIAVGMATSIPPHHVGELADGLAVLLADTQAPDDAVIAAIQGPDFPTGGVLIDPRSSVEDAYRTGRGAFRLRARWRRDDLGYGQYQVIVEEVPYQVQKARLIERIAELLQNKKLTFLADVRDESTEDVRLILVPRTRSVPAEVLMEQMFRLTDLETRVSLNLNVVDADGVPRVMSVPEVLKAFIAHRMEVLERRSRFRLAKIADRLELLEGYLKAFLDIDRVIAIIRENDQPRPILMAEFELTERQADAILNLRLRQLRKLEEFELKRERDELVAEQASLNALLDDDAKRRARLADEVLEMKAAFGAEPRRTTFEQAPEIAAEPFEVQVDRQPVTVICSREGWVRVVRGHLDGTEDLKFKEGDGPGFQVKALSTDKLLVLLNDGRALLLPIEKLPGGRGTGEPLSLFVDIPQGVALVAMRAHAPHGRLILASRAGYGFVAKEADIAAQTRAGKQVMNLSGSDRMVAAVPVRGGSVAVLGSNRKLLIFDLDELKEMARGKGVILQKYRDGTLAGVLSFNLADGLSWQTGSKRRFEADLSAWIGKRATAGRNPPVGFPKSGGLDGVMGGKPDAADGS